ncbi:MAG: GNAT family N-acetyltransferase [Lachnospiraceae bacterium]|jgi:RimJ/RimL family protein N-acetyltransferase
MLKQAEAGFGPYPCAKAGCWPCAGCIRAEGAASRPVFITDEPDEARRLCRDNPVIGLADNLSSGQESAWDGVSWLAEGVEDPDPGWILRAYCRFHRLPLCVLRTENFFLRETCAADLPAMDRLYRDPDCRRFLPHPLAPLRAREAAAAGTRSAHPASVSAVRPCPEADDGTVAQDHENGSFPESLWLEWLASYQARLKLSDGPSYLSLVTSDGQFAGRIGLEYTSAAALSGGSRGDGTSLWTEEGYFLGYALLPGFRGRGLASAAAESLLTWAAAEWDIDRFFILCGRSNTASAAAALRLGFSPAGRAGGYLLFVKSTG